MFIEGKGWASPRPHTIELSSSEVHDIASAARVLAKHRNQDFRNWFIGLLGEGAWSKLLLDELNTRYKCDVSTLPAGDGGIDMEIAGITIQLKTHLDGGKCLVKRISKDSKMLPLVADLFGFAQLNTPLGAPIQRIALLGYIGRDGLEQYGQLRPSPYGHFNLQIETKYLEAMSRFVTYIEAKNKLLRL